MDRNVSLSDAVVVSVLSVTRPPPAVASAGEARHARRLFDKILVAFHHACDANDHEVGERLLGLLELMATRRPRAEDGNRRRTIESLVAAHERLWHLRHPVMD